MQRTPTPRGLRQMRRVATGLLIAVSILYVIAYVLERTHPWVAYVRAFAEAAMVGALADWFAVTALFRHPLGIPIPHTAVIPRSKDRIGEGLGRFVEENFLAPRIVAEKIQAADLAGGLARWLSDPQNSSVAATGLMRGLATIASSLSDDALRQLIRKYLLAPVERTELSPLLGRILAGLMAQQGHNRLVDALLRKAAELVREYEPQLRHAVSVRTSWLWRRLAVDRKVADRLVTVLDEILSTAAEDPDHALRTRINEALAQLCQQLLSSPQFLAEGERLKKQLLEQPAFEDYLRGVGRDLVDQIAAHAASQDSSIDTPLAQWLRGVAENVLNDESLRTEINLMMRAVVIRVFELQRHEVAHLIADTVKQWDADTLSSRMESAIGADLQYIRVNGTLIGGLAGLIIHVLTKTLLTP
ncbi:DUF445 domain-containing protein [Steroidobacter cummioxidans]|uniref:DUF445 domain-containing protein n=1 Tax=Steroidobacter cummioxidans TaxID=1803913 RepID=UPI000E3232FE|nr:DUF445 domain-containing protein [Steroidobacter cummioxidans]